MVTRKYGGGTGAVSLGALLGGGTVLALLGTILVLGLGWLEDEPARPARGLGPLPQIPKGSSLRESAVAEEPAKPSVASEVAPVSDPAAAPGKKAVAPGKQRPRAGADAYEEIDFELLNSFEYATTGEAEVEDGQASEFAAEIPEEVLALDGVRVVITGFMTPVDFDSDGVKSFSLTAIPGGCCYGMVPRLNEWIVVTMPEGERAEYAYYEPVTLKGTLEVGEQAADGVVVSLFRMTPDEVDIGF